ncbi:MAG: cytochrome d ubiquinol oxidase subunit II [Verrucomicrobia bacterium]|nr:cytochrome d ubiquinol oxidase subunit II [Verrucomicrobiota bacterium]MBS0646725.1 cytochrome d ubiquinol oxidase subunit II [Verrucomicrobiota bacterium]
MFDNLEYLLTIFWYVVLITAVVQYAMLDGFDLGVGMLLLCTKKDEDRRIFMNAIGPVWDGNEVWLVIVMGALFAGFPLVYAKLLSSFYSPIMVLVFALIFRAVAIEFRSKRPSRAWRQMWDVLFFGASLVIAFALGVALGNFVTGIPLGEHFEYQGGIVLTFLRPYPVLVGLLTVSLFTMHGAIFLTMKTMGELHDKLLKWVRPSILAYMVVYVVVTFATLIYEPHIVARFHHYPWLFSFAVVDVLVLVSIFWNFHRNYFGWAFLGSCANIMLLLILFASGMFPELLRSSIDPAYSLTIFNTVSSVKTLSVLAIIVAIGLPLVIVYMSWVYHIFRGKVVLDDHSY